MHSVIVDDKKLRFSAAHFVMGSDYCESLHGHNYQVSVRITGDLDKHGMVLDFGVVKKQVKKICDELDHKVILPAQSEEFQIDSREDEIEIKVAGKRYVFPSQDCLLLPVKTTTAELIAKYITSSIHLSDEFEIMTCVSESAGTRGCYEKKSL